MSDETLDWDDFVVVEQVDVYEDAEMVQEPEPVPKVTVPVQLNEPEPALALDPDMKIKTNHVRKTDDEKNHIQKCPNCKQDINKLEWQNHFKICVLDKNWKDQK